MHVRRLEEQDWSALRDLRLQGLAECPRDFGGAFEDEAAWPEERWRQTLRELVWLAAEGEGGLVGCLILRIPEPRKLRHNGWLHGMYVRPGGRGAGVADALMDAVEAQARAFQVTILKLYVAEDNARATAFYKRRGFVAYGREPDSHRVEGVSYASFEMAKAIA